MNLTVDPTSTAASFGVAAAQNLQPSIDSAARELEIKFATDSTGLALASASALLQPQTPDAPPKNLISVYFDTAAGDLKAQGLVLRVRRTGRSAPVMTLKWKPEEEEGLFSRGEIEIRIRGLQPDLDLFDPTVAARLRAAIEDRALAPQFETRVKRRTRMVSFGATQIEAAFDQGAIVAGDRSWPLCELELELKSGEAADLYEFAARLAETLPLRLDVTSKSARAFLLAADKTPKVVKAAALQFAPGAMLDDAVAAVISNTITHFAANWASLREDEKPESIHQMRVALRRLRAALAMFKRALPCAEFDFFRAEAKRIASALGPARECDAFRNLVEDGPISHLGAKANFEPLLRGLEQRRQDAYREARALIDAPETTIFVVRLQAFLARRGWRNALSGLELGRLTDPAALFAAEALERLQKRATKRGKDLILLPDEERHEVRIVLKNLRYAAEFFGVLFENKSAVQSYIRPVAHLQDLLGAHNDAASAENFLGLTADADAARAAGVVIGWYGRDAIVADAGLAKAWKSFKRARAFWK
jgi:inorganic triphosphatase YgiF